jgi:hypothetical protein
MGTLQGRATAVGFEILGGLVLYVAGRWLTLAVCGAAQTTTFGHGCLNGLKPVAENKGVAVPKNQEFRQGCLNSLLSPGESGGIGYE